MKPSEKIIAQRQKLRLTDIEVAKQAGLSLNNYFDIEHHDEEIFLYPPLRKVKIICKILGLSCFELLNLSCNFCIDGKSYVEDYLLPRNELIKNRRKIMKLTTEKLGEYVGFHAIEIEKLEKDPDHIETWPIDFIKDLAKVINVPLQILLDIKCEKCNK